MYTQSEPNKDSDSSKVRFSAFGEVREKRPSQSNPKLNHQPSKLELPLTRLEMERKRDLNPMMMMMMIQRQ